MKKLNLVIKRNIAFYGNVELETSNPCVSWKSAVTEAGFLDNDEVILIKKEDFEDLVNGFWPKEG